MRKKNKHTKIVHLGIKFANIQSDILIIYNQTQKLEDEI